MKRTDMTAVIKGEGETVLRAPVFKGSDYYLYAMIGDQFMKLTDITAVGYAVRLLW